MQEVELQPAVADIQSVLRGGGGDLCLGPPQPLRNLDRQPPPEPCQENDEDATPQPQEPSLRHG